MDKPFKGPSRTEEFYIIPKEIIEDLTLLSSAVRLYAIIKKRTTGEHDVSSVELCKATGLTRSRVKALKSMLGKRGFLQRAYDQYGRPYYSAVFNLENARKDTDLFLSVSVIFNHVANTKSFLLLKVKTDTERFLIAMEKMEWDKQDKPDSINNPIGLLKFYLDKDITPKKGFHRGWWKIRLKQKELRKEADRIALRTSAALKREKQELESFDKYLSSASKEYKKSLDDRTEAAFKENGGKSEFLIAPVKRAKMFEIWKEDMKNENHRDHRHQGKNV
jgi:hypothetical protein